jgi:hypothetical protein
LLNINTTTGSFYPLLNLNDLLNRFGNEKSRWRVEDFIRRLRVQTTYILEYAHCKKANHAKEPRNPLAERIHTIKGLPFTDVNPQANNVYFKMYADDADEVEQYMKVQTYWKQSEYK